MEEVFENKVLDDLYEIRKDGFEAIYVKMYGEKGSLEKTRKAEEFFRKLIEQLVEDEKIKNIILKSFSDFQDSMIEEMLFWDKQYYKLGFLNESYLKKEIREKRQSMFLKEDLIANSDEETFSNHYDEIVTDLVERDAYMIGKKDRAYNEKIQRMRNLKSKYPNIVTILEEKRFVQLTEEETNALIEYIDLSDDIEALERLIVFKQGIKEGIKI